MVERNKDGLLPWPAIGKPIWKKCLRVYVPRATEAVVQVQKWKQDED